ncbi:MAG: hypothetical protein PHT91_02895, partial [Candidatus Nanoarchaeia archaeon]|nr:hypothetical protein [Candidatus Nanoarchaeia archaeon]
MAADVFGFYTIVAMGLFTVLSIIIGYALLNTAVVNVARGSAYYTYTRITESISLAMLHSSSSATNLNVYPRYLIFSAYFEDEQDIYYNVVEGLRMFSYGINHNHLTHFNRERASITGNSYSNMNDPLREELKKCVKDQCICFGEMEEKLNLAPEYFKPLACVDICWGEFPDDYSDAITYYENIYFLPYALVNAANNHISSMHPQSKCAQCANFMNNANNYDILDFQGLGAVVTKSFSSGGLNSQNYAKLEEFSRATKFSFVPNIIECVTMTELANPSMKTVGNAPHLFVFSNQTTSTAQT